MLTNREVCVRFWQSKEGHNRSISSTGDKLFSYSTCILQRRDGKVVGNVTKYSRTTSKHQSLARVRSVDYVVGGVRRGTKDLLEGYCPEGQVITEE